MLAIAIVTLGVGCGLEDPLRVQHVACGEDFESCAGGGDCFARCLCESASRERCEAQCGASTAPRVSDLDESGWPASSAAFEEQVLSLTNEARAQGGCCGAQGCFDASAPLTLEPALRTSARAHALDMAQRDYFDHDTPEGLSPFDRMREAGYRGCALGENIAAGQRAPQEVLESWLGSPGHCANMLQPGFRVLGVGYARTDAGSLHDFWVQNFGG